MGRCTCISQKRKTLDAGGPAKIWEVGALEYVSDGLVRTRRSPPGFDPDMQHTVPLPPARTGRCMASSILGTWVIIEEVGDYRKGEQQLLLTLGLQPPGYPSKRHSGWSTSRESRLLEHR